MYVTVNRTYLPRVGRAEAFRRPPEEPQGPLKASRGPPENEHLEAMLL